MHLKHIILLQEINKSSRNLIVIVKNIGF